MAYVYRNGQWIYVEGNAKNAVPKSVNDYLRYSAQRNAQEIDYRKKQQKALEEEKKMMEEQSRQKKLPAWYRLITALDTISPSNAAYRLDKDKLEGKIGKGVSPASFARLAKYYGEDVFKTAKVALTGKDTDGYLAGKKTMGDNLSELKGWKDRKEGKWYQPWKWVDASDVVGLGLDIASDPSTYVGTGLAKGGVKAVGKDGVEALVSRAGRKALEEYTEAAAKKGVSKLQATTKWIQKEFPKVPAYRAKSGIRFAGKELVTAEQMAKVPVAGKYIKEIGEKGGITGTLTAIERLAEDINVPVGILRKLPENQLGKVLRIVGTPGKKVAAVREAVNSVFDPLTSTGLKNLEGGDLALKRLAQASHKIQGEGMYSVSQVARLAKEAIDQGVDVKTVAAVLENAPKAVKKAAVKVIEEAPQETGRVITGMSKMDALLNSPRNAALRRQAQEATERLTGPRTLESYSTKLLNKYGAETGQEVIRKIGATDLVDLYRKAYLAAAKQGKIPASRVLMFDDLMKDILKGGRDELSARKFRQAFAEATGIQLPPITSRSTGEVILDTKGVESRLGRRVAKHEASALAYLVKEGTEKLKDKEVRERAARIIMEGANRSGNATSLRMAQARLNTMLYDLGIKGFRNTPLANINNAVVKPFVEEMRGRFAKMFKDEYFMGISYNEIDNYVHHMLSKEAREHIVNGMFKEDGMEATFQKLTTNIGANKTRTLRMTIDEANAMWQKKYGYNLFDDNAFSALAEREIQHIKAKEVYEMSEELIRSYGVPAVMKDGKYVPASRSLIKDGVQYVPVMYKAKDGVSKYIPEFEGVLMPKELAETVEKFYTTTANSKELNKALKLIDGMTNLWKGTVTGLWMAFHVRNAYGGLFNNFLAGVINPKYYEKTEEILSKTDGKKIFTTKSGQKISYDKIRAKLLEYDITNQTGYLDLNEELGKLDIDEAVKGGALKKIKNSPKSIMQSIENRLRIPVFLSELDKGNTFEGAAEAVNKFHFDYTKNAHTWAENEVLRRIMPFYVWTRHNIPLQLEQMGKQPGKYSAVAKVMMGDDREDYDNVMRTSPDWLSKKPLFKVGSDYMNIELPMADVSKVWSPKELAFLLHPGIKIGYEQAANFNSFKSEPITNDSMSPEEKRNARLMHVANMLASRTISNAERITNDNMTWDQKIAQGVGIPGANVGLGAPVYRPEQYMASEFRKRALDSLPESKRKIYDSLHIKFDGKTPLMNSARKASIYLDNPEFFLLDRVYYKQAAKKYGNGYDPIYDLPWEKAQQYFAQQAAGDDWNQDELEKQPWYNEFKEKRSEYFKNFKNAEDSTHQGSEAEKYYEKASDYVQGRLNRGDTKDEAVKRYFERLRALENQKRADMGLLTEEPKSKIDSGVYDGLNKFKESTGKSLVYMQIMRLAGLNQYDKWFDEHPDVDPLKGAEIKGLSKFKPYKKKPKRLKYSRNKAPITIKRKKYKQVKSKVKLRSKLETKYK